MSQQSIVHEVLAKKPKRRVEWVQKRLKEDLAIQHRDSLYEVLVRKEGKAFASDINGADAMRTYNAVLAAIDLFTTKQQRHLQAETFFLRKLHAQEQDKQERFAREAKARAQEAKKAAKAAKERQLSATQSRPPRMPSPTPVQGLEDSSKVTAPKSPDIQPVNVETTRSRSRSPLPRADASKPPERERSPSPDWIPRTPPDPPAQVPTKSTGSWTTTVHDEPVKDDRAPTVVAPRKDATEGASAGRKRSPGPAQKRSNSSSSTEYDAFGTGPDPVALRSPSRERKNAKQAPQLPSTSSTPSTRETPKPPADTGSVATDASTGNRLPSGASSEVSHATSAAGKRESDVRQKSAAKSRPLPPAKEPAPPAASAVKQEPSAPQQPSAQKANGASAAAAEQRPSDAAPSGQASMAPKTEAADDQNASKPDAEESEASEETDEEEEEEEGEEDEEEDAQEGSESESSSAGEDGGSQAPTSPADAPGNEQPQEPEAAKVEKPQEGSGSDSGSSESSSESAEAPKSAPRVKLVKLEASARTKPVLEPAKPPQPKLTAEEPESQEPFDQEPSPREPREPPKREQRRRLPPPPPPPRRSRPRIIADIKVPDMSFARRAPQLPLWRYVAPDGEERLAIRSGPGLDAPTTGLSLASGEVFPVSQERPGDSGVLFLRIADGRGWVFDRKCGRARKRRARPLCMPYQVPLLEDEDRAGPKVSMGPRAVGPNGPLPLDRLSSIAKHGENHHKGRKRRRRGPAVTMDPYLAAQTVAYVPRGEVIEVGSDDEAEEEHGARDKLGRKKVIKEQLRQQLEEKQTEVQALRQKLNQLDRGRAPNVPVRRVMLQQSNESRTVGMSDAPEGPHQHDPLVDEKRQHLQAMLAKKRAMGYGQSAPAKKPTPRFVD